MFNAIKTWWDKPITRGDVVKYNFKCAVGYAILGGVLMAYAKNESKKLDAEMQQIKETDEFVKSVFGEEA